MPYDSSLDENVFADSWETEATRINVSVFSYNKGPNKVQITRENKDANGNFRFTKLGRMSKEELAAVMPLLKSALEKM
ncbi:MAG: hypothetical protein JW867_02105 [Candidatus Omnitrophica bacterium]|nr:hypothetical protein [Candidatus Omnitrophota bacterium]